MSESSVAHAKFPCPACGGEVAWNPGKSALVCPFCGTQAPGEMQTDGSIVEHDLAAALRAVPDEERGWGADRLSVKCQSCQAVSVFEVGRVGQRCDFCGSSSLVPFDEIKAPIQPGSLLPFRVSESAVREKMRDWYASHWLAPNKLKRLAMTDELHGMYLPFWTFDANAVAEWTAESGDYYYAEERTKLSDGRTVSRRVRHTRWRPASGQLNHFFDDVLVPATKGLPHDKLHAVEPFPTHEAVAFQRSYLSGWVVEQYQIDLVAAAAASRRRMTQELRRLCAKQVPGDTHRNLEINAAFSDPTFKHMLLPVWILSYTYGSKTFRCVVNGYTGRIAGDYPVSWVKIALIVVVVLMAILGFLAFQEG